MLQLNFTPFPVINTGRIVLRKPKIEDAKEMLFLRSDERVMKYIDRPRTKTIQEASEYIERINKLTDENEAINWAITLATDDVLIGTICFWRIERENHRAEVGYMLHPDYHRQGIMKETLQAVVQFGFNTLNFHSIVAIINPSNTASGLLLKGAGFEQEAYFHENYYFNGKFLDSAVYCLINKN